MITRSDIINEINCWLKNSQQFDYLLKINISTKEYHILSIQFTLPQYTIQKTALTIIQYLLTNLEAKKMGCNLESELQKLHWDQYKNQINWQINCIKEA